MPNLLFIMPTQGEYRVVEVAVRRPRLPVELVMCGVGPGRAAALCAELERERPPQGVALLGWAGGLSDGLAPGDIVLADQALWAGRSAVDCMRLPLQDLPRVYCGPILTTAQVLATSEAKRSAGQSGALAVEMEGYPLAAWAAGRGIPFVHGRVILDGVDEAVPELDGVLDGYGRVRAGNLLGVLARRPALLREIARFPVRLRRVNRRLAELAVAAGAAWLRA